MEPLPQRKPLRLPGYDYSQNGAYFVTLCTEGRQCLFGHVVGGDAHIAPQVHLSPCGMLAKNYLRGINGLDMYVIMPNHIHMIICIESGDGSMWASTPTKRGQSISRLVRSFKILTTKAAGFPLWQRSFYDHVIRSQADYERIWQYIDENPAKWAEDTYYKETTP